MPNDSIRHRAIRIHQKPQGKAYEQPPEVKAEATTEGFLIDSGFWPLVLIGKGVRCFGWAAVLAFVFGVVSLWGYAAATKTVPLVELKAPPIALPSPSPQTKMVRLSGFVRDAKHQQVKGFVWVGVLAKQQGPVLDPDGAFSFEVPESDSYDVAVWSREGIAQVFDRMPVVQDAKGSGWRLSNPLPFPPSESTTEHSGTELANTRSKDEVARANPR